MQTLSPTNRPARRSLCSLVRSVRCYGFAQFATARQQEAAQQVSFEDAIRPVLESRCVACHGES